MYREIISQIISSLKAGILCLLKDKPSTVIAFTAVSPTLQCIQQRLNQYLCNWPSADGGVSGLWKLVYRNKGTQVLKPTVYGACV